MGRRLLFLSDRYPPYYTGGYEIACQTTVDALAARGWKTLVLTSTFGIPRPRRDGHVWRVLHRPEDAKTLFQLGTGEIADQWVLKAVLRLWKPEAVYVWCIRQLHPSLHATLRDSAVPVVFNVADVWWPAHLDDGRQRKALWAVNRAAGPKALAKRAGITAAKWCVPTFRRAFDLSELGVPHVIACSRFREQQHLRLNLPATDPVVIYNGLDMSRFSGAPDAFDELRILFSGRLVAEKGPHTAIQAIAALAAAGIHRVRLTIAGVRVYPWEYSDSLRRLVADHRLEDRVSFIDSVPYGEIADLYRRHNILVFPSQCDEGLPMTVLEAMATGLLVVGTTTGGSGEMLQHERTGDVVAPDDPAGLAAALRRALEDPARAHALAAEGQRHVRSIADLNHITDQTETYLRRMIDLRHDAHQ